MYTTSKSSSNVLSVYRLSNAYLICFEDALHRPSRGAPVTLSEAKISSWEHKKEVTNMSELCRRGGRFKQLKAAQFPCGLHSRRECKDLLCACVLPRLQVGQGTRAKQRGARAPVGPKGTTRCGEASARESGKDRARREVRRC